MTRLADTVDKGAGWGELLCEGRLVVRAITLQTCQRPPLGNNLIIKQRTPLYGSRKKCLTPVRKYGKKSDKLLLLPTAPTTLPLKGGGQYGNFNTIIP